MTKTKLGMGVSLLVLLYLFASRLPAADQRDQPGSDRVRSDARVAPRDARTDRRPPAVRSFRKPVKLEFHLGGKGEEELSLLVLCLEGSRYAISLEGREADSEHAVKLEGMLLPGDYQDRIAMTYEAFVTHGDGQGSFEARLAVEGSAIVKLGEVTTLARFGDQSLTVEATLAE